MLEVTRCGSTFGTLSYLGMRSKKSVESMCNLRAPRTTRLPKLKPRNMTTPPANSRYEWGSLGGQVRRPEVNLLPNDWLERPRVRRLTIAKHKQYNKLYSPYCFLWAWRPLRPVAKRARKKLIQYMELGHFSKLLRINQRRWSTKTSGRLSKQ